MNVKDIAARINAHLQRFEADPEVNRYQCPTPEQTEGSALRPYYHARAWALGGYVRVTYISYQGSSSLTKANAGKYLAWLDAGHEGRHYEALRALADA